MIIMGIPTQTYSGLLRWSSQLVNLSLGNRWLMLSLSMDFIELSKL